MRNSNQSIFFTRFLCILSLLGFSFASTSLQAQGLMVNEVSNGPSGTKEYVEYVVLGASCTTVDLRGWIIDDNNGDFACGPISGVGIAQGHCRFALVANWAAVPAGAIILIYNDADLNALIPAADPTDANADSVYILPSSSTLLDRTTGGTSCPLDAADQIPMGCNASCPAAGSNLYLPSVYTSGGSNTQISLANGGDATQVRNPAGTYFHGISYGTAVAVTGGPDNLKISNLTGAGKVYFFNGGNFRSLANWTEGVDDGIAGGSESPGARNNAANSFFVDSVLGNCLLPVIYAQPLTAEKSNETVQLTWATAEETNHRGFTVLRMTEKDRDFTAIGEVNQMASPNGSQYSFNDPLQATGLIQYRLIQHDLNGGDHYSTIASVQNGLSTLETAINVFPNPAEDEVNFSLAANSDLLLTLTDIMGKTIYSQFIPNPNGEAVISVNLSSFPAGLYHYSIVGTHEKVNGILSVR